MRKIICTAMGIVLMYATVGLANDFVGGLRKVIGEAHVVRNSKAIPAEDGMRIYSADILKTGKNGSMGIVFNDNTRISLGSDSELMLEEYVFQPKQEEYSLISRMARGTASFISGTMTKLSPEAVRFKTPKATIGVRGTSFLVKVDAEQEEK